MGRGLCRDLHIQLSKGFEGRVHLVDEEGNSIKGATVKGRFTPSPSVGELKAITDGEGIATFPSVGDIPADLSISAEGFESTTISGLKFIPEESVKCVLRKAKPFKGRIISSNTGEPVANAEIKLAGVNGPQRSGAWPTDAAILATTNQHGEFVLTTLRADSTYTFYVSAKGYGKRMSPFTTISNSPVEWELGEPISLRGKVAFPSSPSCPESIEVECHQTFKVKEDSNYDAAVEPPQKIHLKGGVGYFEFHDLYAVPTEINILGRRKSFPALERSLDNVVIEFAKEETPEKQKERVRTLEISFDLPSKLPQPTGSLRIGYYEYGIRAGVQRSFRYAAIPIKNGKGSLQLPVPNEVEIEAAGLVGYSFSKARNPIPEGEGVHSIILPVTPAGAIYGEITEHDGSLAKGVFISVYTRPDAKGNRPDSLSVKSSAHGNTDVQKGFIATPLALENIYSVVVDRSQTYVVSSPISINKQTPIQKTKIVIPKGTTVRVRAVDPSGNGIRGLKWNFNFTTAWGNSFGSGNLWTEGDGWLIIPNVNFDAGGEYRIELQSRSTYFPVEQVLDPRKPEFQIRLQRGKSLTGTVLDSKTGWPVNGVDVYAVYKDGTRLSSSRYRRFEAEATSDEQGRFRFSNLPDEAVTIRFSNANYPDGAQSISVIPGQVEPILLRAKILPDGGAQVVKPPKAASPAP